MKTRIVIIAQTNYISQENKGLYKIIKHTDNYTDLPFIKNYLFESIDNSERTDIICKAENKYLCIKKDEVSLYDNNANNKFEDWDIVVISDQIEPTKYPKEIFSTPDKVFLMYHTQPKIDQLIIFLQNNTLSSKIIMKQGWHETGNNNGYPLFIELVKTWDEQQNKFKDYDYEKSFKEIIKKWFRYNEEESIKKKLMDVCLNKETIDYKNEPFNKLTAQDFWNKKLNVLNPKINNDIGNNTVKQIVGELQNDVNNGYEEYLIKNDKKIKALRDALFGSD